MYTLPTTAVADIFTTVGDLITANWVIIALVVGVPFGFYIIRKLITLIPKR
jgi:hypothetical protein